MLISKNYNFNNRSFKISKLRHIIFGYDFLIFLFVFQAFNFIYNLRNLAKSFGISLINIGSKLGSSLWTTSANLFIYDSFIIYSNDMLALTKFFDTFLLTFGVDIPYIFVYKQNIISTYGNIFKNILKKDWHFSFITIYVNLIFYMFINLFKRLSILFN